MAEGPLVVGFGPGAVALGYEAGYIGSEKCASCHIHHGELQKSHRMALTSQRATRQNLDLWFAPERLEKPVEWPSSEPSSPMRYRREGERVFLEGRDPQGGARAEVEAVFGSGNRGFTPIAMGGNGIRELRVTFMGPKDCWTLTPGAADDPDPLGYVRSHETSVNCLGCHTTALAWAEDRLDLDRTVFGIGCERCHGPGSAHVEAILEGKGAPMIYNPGRLRGGEQVRFCGQCHRLPADLEPHNVLKADPSTARHAGAGLMLSACFRRSPPESTITCLDCHSPHRNIDRARDGFNRPCARCHPSPEKVHRSAAVLASSDCVACHMSVETEGFFGLSFTSHWIRRPEKPPRLGAEERREYVRFLEASYREGIARPAQGPEKSSALRMRLGKLLFADGDREDGLGWIRQALSFAPFYKDRLQAAELHEKAGKPAEAARILEDAVRLTPENNWAYHSLARLRVAAGRLDQAEAVLESWGRARPGDPALDAARAELQQLKTGELRTGSRK